jgi:Tfp pilus assembly protein PilO
MAAVSLKPSSKGVTVLIIVAALILFGCVLSYVAAAGKLKTATTELRKKEQTVSASKEMAQRLEKSKLDYVDVRSQVRFLESSVSTQDYVPTLLKQLEHLGRSVDLKVVGIRPEPKVAESPQRKASSGAQAAEGNVQAASQPATAGVEDANATQKSAPYDELKINVEAEGKYINALDFLYRLTTFPKIIAVNTVEMTPDESRTVLASPKLNIKLSITAFVLKDGLAVGKPAKAGAAAASAGKAAKGGDGNAAG